MKTMDIFFSLLETGIMAGIIVPIKELLTTSQVVTVIVLSFLLFIVSFIDGRKSDDY